MAYEIKNFCYSLVTGIDFTNLQYAGIVIDANGEANAPGAEESIDGVIQDNPGVGETAQICQSGITMLTVGSVGVSAGEKLEVEADGKVVTLNTGVAIGKALNSGVAGEVISVLLY